MTEQGIIVMTHQCIATVSTHEWRRYYEIPEAYSQNMKVEEGEKNPPVCTTTTPTKTRVSTGEHPPTAKDLSPEIP